MASRVVRVASRTASWIDRIASRCTRHRRRRAERIVRIAGRDQRIRRCLSSHRRRRIGGCRVRRVEHDCGRTKDRLTAVLQPVDRGGQRDGEGRRVLMVNLVLRGRERRDQKRDATTRAKNSDRFLHGARPLVDEPRRSCSNEASGSPRWRPKAGAEIGSVTNHGMDKNTIGRGGGSDQGLREVHLAGRRAATPGRPGRCLRSTGRHPSSDTASRTPGRRAGS